MFIAKAVRSANTINYSSLKLDEPTLTHLTVDLVLTA